jgi:hypothetical protein
VTEDTAQSPKEWRRLVHALGVLMPVRLQQINDANAAALRAVARHRTGR